MAISTAGALRACDSGHCTFRVLPLGARITTSRLVRFSSVQPHTRIWAWTWRLLALVRMGIVGSPSSAHSTRAFHTSTWFLTKCLYIPSRLCTRAGHIQHSCSLKVIITCSLCRLSFTSCGSTHSPDLLTMGAADPVMVCSTTWSISMSSLSLLSGRFITACPSTLVQAGEAPHATESQLALMRSGQYQFDVGVKVTPIQVTDSSQCRQGDRVRPLLFWFG